MTRMQNTSMSRLGRALGRCAVVVAAVVLATALASCGGDDGAGGTSPPARSAGGTPPPAATAGGDRQQIRAEVERVFDDVYAASRAGDGEKVCRNVTARHARALVAAFSGDTCEEAVRNARRSARGASLSARPRYSAFSTDGRTARIRATVSNGRRRFNTDLTFRYVDGGWKVDRSAGG